MPITDDSDHVPNILIADDDVTIVQILRNALRGQGTLRVAGDNPSAGAGTSTIFGSTNTWADGTIMRSGTNLMLQMGTAAGLKWSIGALGFGAFAFTIAAIRRRVPCGEGGGVSGDVSATEEAPVGVSAGARCSGRLGRSMASSSAREVSARGSCVLSAAPGARLAKIVTVAMTAAVVTASR